VFRKNVRLAPAIPDWTKIERLKAEERGEAPLPGMFEQISREEVEKGLKVTQLFTENLAERFSSQLVLNISAQNLYVAKMSSKEFVQRYANVFLVYAELVYPEFGSLFCLWDYALAQSLLNRLAGGPGEAQVDNEELTMVERTLFETLLQEAVHSFNAAWRGALSGDPQKTTIFAPRLNKEHIFAENEDLIVMAGGVAFPGQKSAYITWVFPVSKYATLIRNQAALGRPGKKRIRLSPDAVSVVDVPIKAQLGKAIISMKDVLRLQRGDIIVLDKFINEPVSVWIGQETQFLAQAGSLREHLAVQLLSPSRKISSVAEPLPEAEKPEEEQPEEVPAIKTSKVKEEEPLEEERTEEQKADDDILANIEDVDDEEDEEFVWDEEEDKDEDF
jgi:flagellar motor switch protein FliM